MGMQQQQIRLNPQTQTIEDNDEPEILATSGSSSWHTPTMG